MVGQLHHVRPSQLIALAALLAAAVGIGAGAGIHLAVGSSPTRATVAVPPLHGETVWPAGGRAAPSFALRDQDGRLVSLAELRGRTVVLAFVGPGCGRDCAELRALGFAEREVARADRPVLLIVGGDANASPLAGDWHRLNASRAQLTRLGRAYDTDAVYLIDRRGFERVGLLAPLQPSFIADDLRVLAREPS